MADRPTLKVLMGSAGGPSPTEVFEDEICKRMLTWMSLQSLRSRVYDQTDSQGRSLLSFSAWERAFENFPYLLRSYVYRKAELKATSLFGAMHRHPLWEQYFTLYDELVHSQQRDNLVLVVKIPYVKHGLAVHTCGVGIGGADQAGACYTYRQNADGPVMYIEPVQQFLLSRLDSWSPQV